MSEYSPPNWTEPLPIYNPVNFRVAQATNGGGGGSGTYLNFPVAQGSQTMKNTLVNGSFQVSGGQSINMGANVVQNAGTPVNPTDLATKAYVDLNAGTQNLQSVLTAGNTTGNFHISHADNYGDIYNGAGAESWVVACDPIQFSSSATNDLYLASNSTDNFVRFGSYSGSTFTETARIGDLATGEKRAIFAGTLNAVCIEDATGSKGTAGQVLTAGGSGASLVWGAGGGGGAGTLDQTLALGNTATGAYANITLTDSSAGGQANPIMTLVNTNTTGSVALEVYKNKPVAVSAGDVLFNESVYGKDSAGNKQEYTRIAHTIRDGASGGEDGSIEFNCFTAGAVATFIQINGVENEVNILKNLDMGGNTIKTSTANLVIDTTSSTGVGTMTLSSKGNVAISSSGGSISTTSAGSNTMVASTGGITQTATTGNVSITATAGNLNLTAGATMELVAGTGGGIQTNQASGQRSVLRTGYANGLQNLDYYPSYVIENTGGAITNIPTPYVPYQNLTLINSGISPTYNWSDVGDPVGTNLETFYRASSGLVWVGADNNIKVYADLTFTNPPLFIFSLASSSGAFCFHEAQGFMYVGGQFAGITGQPQAQFSLLRFAGANTTTPVFDPMFDSTTGVEGFTGQIYAITSDNVGNLYVGGLFATTFPTAITMSNLCIIGNAQGASGTQIYSNDSGQFSTNGVVYAMYEYNNSGQSNIYVGGNFTDVANGFQTIAYGAVYYVGWGTSPPTPFTTIGQGNFNSLINSFAPSVVAGTLLFTGAFSFVENGETINFGGWSELASPLTPVRSFNIATIGASGLVRNGININNSLSYNFFITDNKQVWYGTDNNSWEDGGIASAVSGNPTGIIWNGTYPYVLMPNSTTGVRVGVPSSSSATFELPSEAFRTTGGTFKKAILAEYQAQQFVADGTGQFYFPLGSVVATFSN